MKLNNIPSKYPTFIGLTSERIQGILDEIAKETGFVPEREVHRRTIYTPDKVWQVRYVGTWKGERICARIEALQMETDREVLSAMFADACQDDGIRPPRLVWKIPFSEARGYGYVFEEYVEGVPLYDPSGDPALAAARFFTFYRRLRQAFPAPFLPGEGVPTARVFTETQTEGWRTLAEQSFPEAYDRHRTLTERLLDRMLDLIEGFSLRPMHPHLSGGDVRVRFDASYAVFGMQYLSFRQEAYDAAFPLWTLWLARPADAWTAKAIADVTETWRGVVQRVVPDLVPMQAFEAMCLNRLYGSLLLDVPAMSQAQGDTAIAPLEAALVAEAERLLAR